MKFIFIAPIYQMKIDTVLNKGKHICDGMYISNNHERIENILLSERLVVETGLSLIKLLKEGKPYIRIEGEYNGDPDEGEISEGLYGNKYLFGGLRKTQTFINSLWNIKDNGAYIRDGYLYYYNVNKNHEIVEPTYFYTGELTYVNTLSNGSREHIVFNEIELQRAIDEFKKNHLEANIFSYGFIDPTDDHFYDSEPRVRGYYFLQMARSQSTFPMKLLFYCSVLEAIFSIDSSEINHKIAERVAVTIGTTIDDKKNIYNVIKKAYDIRSKVIHGSTIKSRMQQYLPNLTMELDSIIRRIMYSEIYVRLPYTKPEEFNEYFLNLLLKQQIIGENVNV